jgi:long-chain acyl-CoA synthetase
MLTDVLARAVAGSPRKAAVVQGARRVRYNELAELAGRAAGGLRALGVEQGDCVAVVLPNGPELVAALFACARLRAVMLPLNPLLSREELLHFVADARATVVIAEEAAPPAGSGAAVVGFDSLLGSGEVPPAGSAFAGRALYLCTSGSTDTAKRLCCTQENLFYEAHNFVETVGLTAEDNILCTIPLHHSYGLGNCLLDAVYAGSTLVLPERTDAPFVAWCRRAVELIQTEGVRFYPGVPYQFDVLATLSDLPPGALAGLKLCVSSGDVLPRRTYERFRRRFGLPIRSLYGSTEAGSIALDTGPAETMQPGSLGRPLKNVEVRIRDELGRDQPPGSGGAIWVGSPTLPPGGYDNRPELNQTVFRDGYYHTGDVGKLDARGHLVLTGRKQSFVSVGGHKVDVGEVEEVLLSHPGVREAVVLEVEVSELGTLLKAVLVAQGPCPAAEVLAHCRQHLAAFKVPRVVEFRAELPRSPLGKVLRSELGGAAVVFPSGRAATDPDQLTALIQEQAALCLQCEADALGRSASFESMGFDSLRAAELHLRLVKLTGLPLSITLLWNYPSIDRLAAALWARMQAPPGPTASDPAAAAQGLDGLLDEVAGLSDPEVDASFRER